MDALLDTIEALQGAALLASEFETEILPARIADYQPSNLDTLMAAGEVTWVGVEQIGDRNGRIALYLTESLPLLRLPEGAMTSGLDGGRPSAPVRLLIPSAPKKLLNFSPGRVHRSFAEIHTACGGGFPGDTVDALWELVWAGRITNDTFYPLRKLLRPDDRKRKHETFDDERPGSPGYLRRLRSRTAAGQAHGRWSLLRQRFTVALTPTQWSANISQQLLQRNGIVMRETAIAENIPGGYNTIYPALKTMEDSGWVRRGMFVAGLGAAQFAMPAAVDMLRSLRMDPSSPEVLHLAATDPANPYGALIPWPKIEGESDEPLTHHSMARTAGASVILINGQLAAFLRRRNPALRVFLPESEPERSLFARELAKKLAELAIRRLNLRQGLLIGEINDAPAREHFLAPYLEDAGFVNTVLGYQMRRTKPLIVTATIRPRILKTKTLQTFRKPLKMPEGDTIYRAARTLNLALAGQTVTSFESALPHLSRVEVDQGIVGRTVEKVEAQGKWMLMHFSGGLILLSHMLMSGSWHIYRPGETWKRKRYHMRVVIGTPKILAVAFNVPIAEFHTAESLTRREGFKSSGLRCLRKILTKPKSLRDCAPGLNLEIGVSLLTQSLLSGIGNVFKSEVCFACGINPFRTSG